MIVDAVLTPQTADVATIAAYLSDAWREHLITGGGLTGRGYTLPSIPYRQSPPPALDDPLARTREFLDARGIDLAVLDPGTAPSISGIPNALMADGIARATNDWLADRFLRHDERLRGSILVAPRDGELAAAEVRRLGGDERFAQVLLAFPPRLLGDRSLYPLFAAAQEHGLPVTLTAGGAFAGSNPGPGPIGHPTTLFEYRLDSSYGAIPHLVSVLVEGVFERFPALRLVLAGFGIAWLPSLLWRIDAQFDEDVLERPRRLTRRPSEIVREHVRFTTNGLEIPREPARALELLALIDAGGLLLYGSGYPSPGDDVLLDVLPAPLRDAVLGANAHEVLRLRAVARQ